MEKGKEEGSKGTAKVTAIKGNDNNGAGESLGEQPLNRLAKSFEASARRWELVVYPSLFAFIVLACYGFYLIFSLTHDVAHLSRNVSTLTQSIDSMVRNMNDITGDMSSISGNMGTISGYMGEVNQNMKTVSDKMDALEPMRHSIDSINYSTRSMAWNTDRMGHYMGSMDRNVGRPMSMMNSFLPW